jgi:hypothetical protein
VPTVDRRVVLNARVGATPGGLSDHVPDVRGVQRIDDLARGPCSGLPRAARESGFHEVVRDTDGVVGVLTAHRVVSVAVEVRVVARFDQGLRFAFFSDFPLDEVGDFWMIQIQTHHFRGSTRRPAALGGTCRPIQDL